MKQQIIKLLMLPILSLTLLTGCDNNEEKKDAIDMKKTIIPYGQLFDINDPSTYSCPLTKADLLLKIEEQDTFLLIVQGDSISCTCWYDFQNLIEPLQKTHNSQFSLISADDINDKLEKCGIEARKGGNAIYIFNKGIIQDSIFIKDDSPLFEQNKADNDLLKWVRDRVSFKQNLYINYNQFKNLFTQQGKQSFTVCITRKDCGDCNAIFKNVYNKESLNLTKTNYIFDIYREGIYLSNGKSPKDNSLDGKNAKKIYQQFKDDYGLSTTFNHKYGYGNGFVPSLILFETNHTQKLDKLPNNKKPASYIKDMCVYLNDELSPNGDGTYRVSRSYYDGTTQHKYLENIENKNLKKLKSIPETDVKIYKFDNKNYYCWKKECAAKYHDPILTQWFNTYCK